MRGYVLTIKEGNFPSKNPQSENTRASAVIAQKTRTAVGRTSESRDKRRQPASVARYKERITGTPITGESDTGPENSAIHQAMHSATATRERRGLARYGTVRALSLLARRLARRRRG